MSENKSNSLKKVGGIILNVLLWIFVVFSIVVTVIAVSASTNSKGVPTVGGTCFLNVQTDSMDAAKPAWVSADKPEGFAPGAMLLGEYLADDDAKLDALEVGDIVTFETKINGVATYNTHRVIAVDRDGFGYIVSVTTQGDNYIDGNVEVTPTETVYRSSLIARYTGTKFNGIGSVLSFLNTQLGFGLCILLPMAAFFIYEVIRFVKTYLEVKNEGKKTISAEDEELIKQRAIEEYLRQQAEAAKPADKPADVQ